MTDLTSTRRKLDRLLGDLRLAQQQVAQEKVFLREAKAGRATATAAQALVQEVAKGVQEVAHQRIAAVVTRCLKAVFGEDAYTFVIRFASKRGKTEAQLLFVRDGLEVDPVDAAGGGVVDVASFALRLACLLLATPPGRKLLVLDEPFRFVSKAYRPQVRRLLETLAGEMGVQIIMVTHAPELVAGKVIELGGE